MKNENIEDYASYFLLRMKQINHLRKMNGQYGIITLSAIHIAFFFYMILRINFSEIQNIIRMIWGILQMTIG